MEYTRKYSGSNAYPGTMMHLDKMHVVAAIERMTKEIIREDLLPDMKDQLTVVRDTASSALLQESGMREGNSTTGPTHAFQNINFHANVTIGQFLKVMSHNTVLRELNSKDRDLMNSVRNLVDDARVAHQTVDEPDRAREKRPAATHTY